MEQHSGISGKDDDPAWYTEIFAENFSPGIFVPFDSLLRVSDFRSSEIEQFANFLKNFREIFGILVEWKAPQMHRRRRELLCNQAYLAQPYWAPGFEVVFVLLCSDRQNFVQSDLM